MKSIHDEIKFLKTQIDSLEKAAREIIESNDDLKSKFARITEIKGVGEKMALAILADMPDVKNFQKASQFAAFAGVTPSHFQSEMSVNGKSHISKFGSRNVRKALYMSALVAKNYNPHFQKFAHELQQGAKPRKSSSSRLCANCCAFCSACSKILQISTQI